MKGGLIFICSELFELIYNKQKPLVSRKLEISGFAF